ncbi:WXG100-like domain-containing protein [Actinomadura opuntiae]|uniref:WXG100-like domain-containing protein n=1 Tax=Actinomadura sp. OS1-43 TaxID=604315 RepID=UPI00255A9431|nr:ADP-ribosyltransferase [Actinomadura sp. OS1-43]MDL4814886.1 ADP-ribosyltransferase [Actinomadura sp. OS1-43]
MGLEIPAEVQWLSWIVGSDWPEGDETAMRRCAAAWRQAATSINELVGDVTGTVNNVRGTLDAEAAEKFQKNVEQWITTDPRLLPSMAESCEKLAEVLDNGALDIEYAKYMFIALLIVTAIEIAMLIAAAFETFGASTAGIPVAEAAAQTSSRLIFKELMQKLSEKLGEKLLASVLKGAAFGALQGGGLDLLVQGVQIAEGNRKGVDWGKTAGATFDGAIGGAFSGGIAHGAGKIPGVGDAAATPLGNMFKGMAREGASEAISGVAGTVATSAIHGDPLTWDAIAKGATSGAFGGAVGGGKGGLNDFDVPTPGVEPTTNVTPTTTHTPSVGDGGDGGGSGGSDGGGSSGGGSGGGGGTHATGGGGSYGGGSSGGGGGSHGGGGSNDGGGSGGGGGGNRISTLLGDTGGGGGGGSSHGATLASAAPEGGGGSSYSGGGSSGGGLGSNPAAYSGGAPSGADGGGPGSSSPLGGGAPSGAVPMGGGTAPGGAPAAGGAGVPGGAAPAPSTGAGGTGSPGSGAGSGSTGSGGSGGSGSSGSGAPGARPAAGGGVPGGTPSSPVGGSPSTGSGSSGGGSGRGRDGAPTEGATPSSTGSDGPSSSPTTPGTGDEHTPAAGGHTDPAAHTETPPAPGDSTTPSGDEHTPAPGGNNETSPLHEGGTPSTGDEHTPTAGDGSAPAARGDTSAPREGSTPPGEHTPSTSENNTAPTRDHNTPPAGESTTPSTGSEHTPATGGESTPPAGRTDAPSAGNDGTPPTGRTDAPATGEGSSTAPESAGTEPSSGGSPSASTDGTGTDSGGGGSTSADGGSIPEGTGSPAPEGGEAPPTSTAGASDHTAADQPDAMAEPQHDGSGTSDGGQPGIIAGVPMPMGGMGSMGGGSGVRGGGSPAPSGGTRVRTSTPGSGRPETTTRSPNENGRRVPRPSDGSVRENEPHTGTPAPHTENGPQPAHETPTPTENAGTPGDEGGRSAPSRPLTDDNAAADPAHRPIEDVDGQGVVRSDAPPAEPGQPEQTPSSGENAPPERPLTEDNAPGESPIQDVDDQGVVHGDTEPEHREAAPQDGEPEQHNKESGDAGDHDQPSGDDTPGGHDEPQNLADAEQQAREILDRFGDDAPAVDFSSRPIDPAAVQEINRALGQLAADYPGTMQRLNRIASIDMPGEGDTLAYARLHGDDQGIYINASEFDDNAARNEEGVAEEEDGFTVPGGGSTEGVFTHEFGHQLGQRLLEDPQMRADLNQAISDALGVPYDATQPHDAAMKARIEDALSQYGATTPHEMMAEAFTEYRLAENPRDLARAIGGVMDRHLRAETPEPTPSTGNDGAPHSRTTLPHQPHDNGTPGEPSRTPGEGPPRHDDGQMRPDDARPREGEPSHARSEQPPLHDSGELRPDERAPGEGEQPRRNDSGELPLDETRPHNETEPRTDEGQPRSDETAPRRDDREPGEGEQPRRNDSGELPLDESRPRNETEPRPDDGRPRSNETEPRPDDGRPREGEPTHTRGEEPLRHDSGELRPDESRPRPDEHTRPGEGEEGPQYRRSRSSDDDPDPTGGDDSNPPPPDSPAATPGEEPPAPRMPHQQADWNPPQHTREGDLSLAPDERVADHPDLAANTRYTVYQTDPVTGERLPRSVVYTDGDRRVTHVTNFTSDDPNVRVVPPNDNVDVTRPEPGVTHRVDLGHDNPHIFPGEEVSTGHGAAPSATRFDPPADAVHHTWPDTYDVRREGPFATRTDLQRPANARIEVLGPGGKLHGVFWTDGNGNVTHVRTWYGDKTHGFNPELGDKPAKAKAAGVPKPNTHYLIEPHERFRVENNTQLDPPSGARTGDFGDGSVKPGTFAYHTNDRGQAQTASGRPEYDAGKAQRNESVQTDVGRTGGGHHPPGRTDPKRVGEYHGGEFDGGHIFPHEARGPGEKINYFPQESRTNRGNHGTGFTPSETWRHSFEAHLYAQQEAGHTIQRIDFFPEPNDPRVTPEVVHVRWTEMVPPRTPDGEPELYTHYRSFHNVDPSLRGTPPPPGSIPPGSGSGPSTPTSPGPDEPQRRMRAPRPEPGDERVAPTPERTPAPEPTPSPEPTTTPEPEAPAADGRPAETAPPPGTPTGREAGTTEAARPDARSHYGWYESEGPATAPRPEAAPATGGQHTVGTPRPESHAPAEGTAPRSESTTPRAEGTAPRTESGAGGETGPRRDATLGAPEETAPRPEGDVRGESARPASEPVTGTGGPRPETPPSSVGDGTRADSGPRPAENAPPTRGTTPGEDGTRLADAASRSDAAPHPETATRTEAAAPRARAAEPEGERPRTADPELMRRVHENEQIRQIVDQARDTVVNDRGDRLGDLLDDDLRTRLPDHPELARIIEGNGPPPLTKAEQAIHDSLLARPRTLHSLLTHPEAVHILEESIREVNERGAEVIVDEGPTRPAETPLEEWQTEISDRLIREIGTSQAPGQPGFDHEALAAERARAGEDRPLAKDNQFVNDYLDELYRAADEHKDTLHAVLRELANEPEDAKMRPGRKDRVRALDKIINENEGDASTLNDLLGGKVQFGSVSDLYRALDRVQEVTRRHGVQVVSIKDRLRSPQPSGYRDIRMTVRMPNGHIGELRLHLKSFDAVADHEHSLYEVSRDLPNVAEEGAARGEREPRLTPEERAVRLAINARLNERFNEALDQALAPPPRSGDAAAPPDAPHRTDGPDTASRGTAPPEHAPADGTGHEVRQPAGEEHRPGHEDGPAHDRDQEHESGSPHDVEIPEGLPPHLHEVFRGSDETPAGRSFHDPSDPAMRDLARRVPADPQRFVIDGHADADGLRLGGGRRLGVDDLADLIGNDPAWGRREVLLLGCHTGDGDFAARLAERLGVPVIAPHGLAWSDGDGNVYASSGHAGADGQLRPGLPPDGSWTVHHPDGATTPGGQDGYAPGHPREGAAQPHGDAEARGLRDWFRRRRETEPPGDNAPPPHTGYADPRRPAPGHADPRHSAPGYGDPRHPAPGYGPSGYPRHPAASSPPAGHAVPHVPGSHHGTPPGARPGPVPGANPHPGPHPGMRPGVHPGVPPATGPAAPASTHPAAHPGLAAGARPGAVPGTHPTGPVPGAHPGTAPGPRPAAAPGPAAYRATPPGTPPGAHPGTPPASLAGSNPGAHPAAHPAAAGHPAGHPAAHPGGTPVGHPAAHAPGGHPAAHHPGAAHHGPAEGRVGPDGVRRFGSDHEGEQYGENRLAHVYQQLPPHLQHAIYQYTVQSMPNPHLRPGADVAGYLNQVRREENYARNLAYLNNGVMPFDEGSLEAMRHRTDLNDYQRQIVEYVLAHDEPGLRLNEMWRQHLEHDRLSNYLGGDPTPEAFWRRIAELDQALHQPLPEPVETNRGLHDVSFMLTPDGTPLGNRDPQLLIGATQTEPAYMSTSLGVSPAVVDRNPFEFRIRMRLPAGSHGLWMGRRSEYADQRELILPRNTRYRITNVVHTGWTWSPTRDGGWVQRPTYDIWADASPPR